MSKSSTDGKEKWSALRVFEIVLKSSYIIRHTDFLILFAKRFSYKNICIQVTWLSCSEKHLEFSPSPLFFCLARHTSPSVPSSSSLLAAWPSHPKAGLSPTSPKHKIGILSFLQERTLPLYASVSQATSCLEHCSLLPYLLHLLVWKLFTGRLHKSVYTCASMHVHVCMCT